VFFTDTTSSQGPVRHLLRSVSGGDKEGGKSNSHDPQLSPTTAKKLAAVDSHGRVQSLADKMKSGDTSGVISSSAPEGEFTGLVGKARDGLSSSSQSYQKRDEEPEVVVPVKSEAQLQWEQIEKALTRPLKINELDFTDLTEVDDINYVNAQV